MSKNVSKIPHIPFNKKQLYPLSVKGDKGGSPPIPYPYSLSLKKGGKGGFYKTLLLIFLSQLFLYQNSFSAKLDISVSATTKAVSWQNLNFATVPKNKSFYLTDASFGITFTGYPPATDTDTSLDIGLILRAINAPQHITTSSPHNTIPGFYPLNLDTNSAPFVEQAYVRANNLFTQGLDLTAGRQNFILGSGIVLDDNSLGLTGLNLIYNSNFHNITAQVFAFQPPVIQTKTTKETNLVGASLQIPTNGLWQVYALREIDIPQTSFFVISNEVSRIVKDFFGLNYQLKTGKLVFEGEGVWQTGRAKKANSTDAIKYNGYAFLLKGVWRQSFSKLGTGNIHIAFGMASGDNPDTTNTDEAFFPGYGLRYEGVERKGFGEVLGASLYDGWGYSYTTTGFPVGISGLQVINIGVQFPPYKNFYAVVDFFDFTADRSLADKKLGRELDAKFYYLLGDAFKIVLTGGVFQPSDAYPPNTKNPSKISFEVSAKF